MEKRYAGGNTEPSAPPPMAPPLYEEAVAFTADASNQPINIPPYLMGTSPMPMPMPMSMPMPMPMPVPYNQPPNQTTMPVPANYTGTNKVPSQPQNNTEQNLTPPPEVQIVHVHHVMYMLGPDPVKVICPACREDIKTKTISDHQRSAHICCIVLCIIGCCLCSCLPYCMNAFMSVHHFCPNCKNYIGTWKSRSRSLRQSYII